MTVSFTNSFALLLLLLLVPAFWCARGAVRHWKHTLIRSFVAIAVILAMAQPVILSQSEHSHIAFIVDDSPTAETHREEIREQLRYHLDNLPAHSTASVIHLRNPDAPALELDGDVPVFDVVGDRSSVSEALRLADSAIAHVSRGGIVVVSDGLATDQRWGRALQSISGRKIPISSIVVPAPVKDLYPFELSSPQELRVGEVARIQIGIAGNGDNVDVTLKRGDQVLTQVRGVRCSGRTRLELEFEPDRAGFLALSVEVNDRGNADSNTANNKLHREFPVQDAMRVLYFGQRVQQSRAKFTSLVGRGFEFVDGLQATRGERDWPRTLSECDLVVMDDVPVAALPTELLPALREAVQQDGLGLFMSGGMASFGPGGFHKTPVADLLPIEFIQKEEKRDPSTTLVVIIDTSGSMTGQRVQLAKEVARLAMRRLLPHDKVGIVEFYGAKRWAAPIQPASNSIELQRAINRLDAGGGTVILPAIEESFYAMQNIQTRYKHVLVLTDGGVEQGAFEVLVRKMATKGINVSTVLVGGSAHSEFLVNIANWGKGRFYSVSNRFSLPEVILKQPTTARIPAYRPGQHTLTTRGGPGWWGSVDRTKVPALTGYVESRAKTNVRPLIETRDGKHPILASWHRGLGRVTSFTTEPTGPGTSTWQKWDGYGPMLARVLRRTSRSHSIPFTFSLRRDGTRLQLVASRLDANTQQRPTARLARSRRNDDISPVSFSVDDDVRELEFKQVSPNRFHADIFYDPATAARLLVGSDESRMTKRLASDAFADEAQEWQVDPLLAAPLDEWAKNTGGASVPLAESSKLEIGIGGSADTLRAIQLYPILLLLSLLLYLGDLVHRRWPNSGTES